MRLTLSLLFVLVACLAAPARSALGEGEPVTVFAAASLTDALTEIGESAAAQGLDLRFSFAASSTLARQIEAGAAAELFFSANEAWMDRLADEGLAVADSRVSPIANSLVLAAGPGWRGGASVEVTALARLLGEDERLAIGDPAHVPAGIYAKQALVRAGVWSALADKLVYTDNVRAALALVTRGEAALGVVYQTDLAFHEGLQMLHRFAPESHQPITYPLALLGDAPRQEARAAYDYLLSAAAGAIFQRHGFEVRQEPPDGTTE